MLTGESSGSPHSQVGVCFRAMQRNLKAKVCWALVASGLTIYLCADCEGASGSSSVFQSVKYAFQHDMFQMAALMKQYFPISLPELPKNGLKS